MIEHKECEVCGISAVPHTHPPNTLPKDFVRTEEPKADESACYHVGPCTEACRGERTYGETGSASQDPIITRRNAIRDCMEIIHECLTWDDANPTDASEARRELKRSILNELDCLMRRNTAQRMKGKE